MRARLDEFRSFGAEVLVISFVKPDRLAQYVSAHRWPFRVLADPDRSAYRTFGLQSASWWQLLRPRVLIAYARLIWSGWKPEAAQEDVHQLGGDFVLNGAGRVVYSYRSKDPADRPPVADLLAAVAGCASAAAHAEENHDRAEPGE